MPTCGQGAGLSLLLHFQILGAVNLAGQCLGFQPDAELSR